MRRGIWTWIVAFVSGLVGATLAFLLLGGQGAAGQAAAQEAATVPEPGTKLSVEELRKNWFEVSRGRRLRPKSWPNGARTAVTFAFDVSANSSFATDLQVNLNSRQEREYSVFEGTPRMLRLLAKHNIPATFFCPALTDIFYPQTIKSILANNPRNDIALHGWMHENYMALPEAEQRRLLNQAIDYLTEKTGKRPVGVNFPGARPDWASIRLAKEVGLLYDGSMVGGDDAYEILFDGQPSGLIEIPIKQVLNDNTYLGQNGGLPWPEVMFKIWQDEFDVGYEEGSLVSLTMHPHQFHRFITPHLDRLMTYIKSKPDVWIATRAEVASYLKQNVLMATN